MPESDVTRPLAGRRIGILTASASRLGGGVFEAVVSHAEMLGALGAEPIVLALEDPCSKADRGRFGATPVITCPVVGPRKIGFAPGLTKALLRADLACLHLHGIWMYPSAAASRWAAATGKPYLISPHGMLDPWITGRGTAKKAVAKVGYERQSWARATAFHALTGSEAADIVRETGRREIHVVPNAGPPPRVQHCRSFPAPVMVYIGRIHEKKNLVSLVDGWFAARRPAGARLVIAGWGAAREVAQLRDALAHGDGSAEYVGPVFGADKQAAINSARFVVLPSFSEGLPMAMLEAWASGVPTLMTAACNLPEGFSEGAALECGTSPEALSAAITRALAVGGAEWQAMALAATNCAQRHFSPDAVARAWAGIYARAIGVTRADGSVPS